MDGSLYLVVAVGCLMCAAILSAALHRFSVRESPMEPLEPAQAKAIAAAQAAVEDKPRVKDGWGGRDLRTLDKADAIAIAKEVALPIAKSLSEIRGAVGFVKDGLSIDRLVTRVDYRPDGRVALRFSRGAGNIVTEAEYKQIAQRDRKIKEEIRKAIASVKLTDREVIALTEGTAAKPRKKVKSRTRAAVEKNKSAFDKIAVGLADAIAIADKLPKTKKKQSAFDNRKRAK
jgi:hypothetical protein